MNCAKCGAQIKKGAKSCSSCGEPVPVTEELGKTETVAAAAEPAVEKPVQDKPVREAVSSVEKPPLPIKKIAILAGLAVVVIVAAVILVNALKPAKYAKIEDSINFYDTEDGVLVYATSGSKSEIEGRIISWQRSLDEKKAAATILDTEQGGSSVYTLYYISGGKATRVADEVTSFTLAAGGDSIVYLTDYDPSQQTAELHIYNGSKSETISSEFSVDNAFALSPDGKTVVYSDAYDEDDKSYSAYVWNGGKSKLLTEEKRAIIPVVVSNGGKYIYMVKTNSNGETSLYVRKGEDETKLGAFKTYDAVFLNRDGSQIVYNSDGKAYISISGKEKESLQGSVSTFIAPSGTQAYYANNAKGNSIYVLGVGDFRDTFYAASDSGTSSVIRIDSAYKAERVIRNYTYTASLCDDDKTLIYMKGDSLYKIDGLKENAEETELVDEDVTDYVAAGNGSTVFYITRDDEVYYQKGESKPKLITNDIQTAYGYSNNYYGMFDYYNKGGIFYYISDDELYASSDGDKGSQVKGLDGDVKYVGSSILGVTVISNDGDETFYYRSSNGKSFELIATVEGNYDY